MLEDPLFHTQRDRAESFGSVAALYDRYRPPFPAALIDDLAGLRPASVLDVGTGTGKVAAALVRHGLDVLGVEIDPRMAEVARQKDLRVEVARFEDWDDAGRRFDLVTSGDAWHWIDPVAGLAKATSVLRAGGTLARFWNSMVLDADVLAVLGGVYRVHAPSAWLYGEPPPPSEEMFAASGWTRDTDGLAFAETKIYPWERTFAVEEWVQYIATISDHRRLGGDALAALQGAARDALSSVSVSALQAHGRTYAAFSRRA
jgi:SAM-dependent methyltransferase